MFMESKFIGVVLLSLVLCFTQGCSAKRLVPVDQSSIRIKESSPPGLHLSTSAYIDEGNMVVVGRLHKNSINF